MTILEFLKTNKNYLEDLVTRSTYHSNAIEGNTLTYAETYALLYNDNSFKIEGKEPREIYEALNHKEALKILFDELENNNDLNNHFIIKLNETINKNINDSQGFRKTQVFIKGAEHIPPSPEKVPNLMNYFIYNYNNEVQDTFTKIAKYHIEFEKIHPFEDGNGRTGRLIINYELLKNNIPPAIIEKENRTKYYEILRDNNISGLSKFLKELSDTEQTRLNKFGYNK